MTDQQSIHELSDLSDVWRVIWDGKLLIAAVTGAFAVAAIVYSLLATEWYRADVVLVPAGDERAQNLSSRLGGLGSLIGMSSGALAGGRKVESVAVLKSRDFARSFIEDRSLLRILYADQWDADAQRWIDDEEPDIREAIEFFEEQIRHVNEDDETGLITLGIEWTDPEVAADWAMQLVARLNRQMRERSLDEAKRNVAYLQQELENTNLATLKESIGSLLESEMQQLMLARGNEEFAFRVVDSAQVPHKRVRPRRTLIVLAATILGGFLAVCVVLVRQGSRRSGDLPTASG